MEADWGRHFAPSTLKSQYLQKNNHLVVLDCCVDARARQRTGMHSSNPPQATARCIAAFAMVKPVARSETVHRMLAQRITNSR
jgi:hypothetical protein